MEFAWGIGEPKIVSAWFTGFAHFLVFWVLAARKSLLRQLSQGSAAVLAKKGISPHFRQKQCC